MRSMPEAPNQWASKKVTDDPAKDAQLRELVDVLSSRQLAEYAHNELGLYPPGYGADVDPPIALVWPADASDDSDGILMWDAGDGEEG